MQIIKPPQELPVTIKQSIFLAGPAFRDPDKVDNSWRKHAVDFLRSKGFDGTILDPEYPQKGDFFYEDQIDWEHRAMTSADIILFWVARDNKDHIGLTTNVEWGEWFDSGKVVFGAPPTAPNIRYLQSLADRVSAPRFDTLEETLTEALRLLGGGSERVGVECTIPLMVWCHPTFQAWYASQTAVGNELREFKLLWNFGVPSRIKDPLTSKQKVFCWVAKVHVYIASEDRVKTNEFVFGRTDISAVAMFYLDSEETANDSVLLVREFRSPARTPDAFIWELPGGSSASGNPKEIALKELEEETSLELQPSRIKEVAVSAQLCGTLSAHICHLYAGELSLEEWEALDQLTDPMGIESDSERTYIEKAKVQDILVGSVPVDWSTKGMILNAYLALGR